VHEASAIPTSEPTRVRAGDTLKWNRTDSEHSPADGWALKYSLLKAGKQIEIKDALVTSDGDTFKIVVPAATSADYLPGEYRWYAFVSKGAERFQVGEGVIEILPDAGAVQASGLDTRSQTKRILDAINALLEGRASTDAQQYSIGSRQITKMTPDELMKWKAQYEHLYRQERIARGEQVPKISIGVSFGGRT
jgi:hypothetical protein